MTKIYFIDGKKVNLDSSEWNLIYADGRWNSRGVNLYFRKKDDIFILENWTNWQGETSTVREYSRQEAIAFLLGEEHHPERVNDAFEQINYTPDQY